MTKRRCRLMKSLYIISYVVTCFCVAYSIIMLLESCDMGWNNNTKIAVLLVLLLAFFVVMLVIGKTQIKDNHSNSNCIQNDKG